MRRIVILILVQTTLVAAGKTIEIEAAMEGDLIRGTVRMVFNNEDEDELWIYLPANHDRDPNFTEPVKQMDLFADNSRGAYPFESWMEVDRLAINGEEVGDFLVEGVKLRVGPIGEGPLEITLDFTTLVPEYRHLWGSTENLCVLSGWHPQPWPTDESGKNLNARPLPWGVFPGQPADYDIVLTVQPGWIPLGDAGVDETGAFLIRRERSSGVDLLLAKAGGYSLTEEVWGGLSVELVDLTPDDGGARRLHFIREVYDRYADWFSPLDGRLTIVAADVPLFGDEYYDGLVLLGAIDSYPLMRLPELAYARQMAGQWFRTGIEVDGFNHPFLVDGLAHWAAREALISVYGEGRDLFPVAVPGLEQEWLARTFIEDLRQSGRDRPPSAAADGFDQPETYHTAIRDKGSQALTEWARRWDATALRRAVARYLEKIKNFRAIPPLFFRSLTEEVGYEPTAELARDLGFEVPEVVTGAADPAVTLTPREVEEPGFELRILPDALDPEAWTLFIAPFPWLDYDDSWRLGAALWGREGIHLLPMEIWGDNDLLLSATYSFDHGDWNLLAQYTTRLDGVHPGLRLGLACYSRKDEQGGVIQFSVPIRPRLSHAPELEFTLGLGYCRLRSWDPGDRTLRLSGEDGRQLSLYGSFYLNARGVLGGPQLYLGLEYAFDPKPHLDSEHPPIDYFRFMLRAQEDLRFAPWLWTTIRGILGHIEGYAPTQRRFELTEDDVSLEYDLIRLPQAGNIRGYNDLDLYADDMLVLTAELYAPVYSRVEFGFFYDRGVVAGDFRSLFNLDKGFKPLVSWRSAFGPLLRYRFSDSIYLEFNFPLWVSDPYTDEAEPGGSEWGFRWDFDGRIGF